MRGLTRRALVFSLILAAFTVSACKRRHRGAETQPEQAPGTMLSELQMADTRAAVQLAKGFYGPEGNAWRWTQQHFSVVLAPPPGAAQKGAKLVFHFTLPEAEIAKLGPITLSASVAGQDFPPQTYSAAGDYVFERSVPATLLTAQAVNVDFQTDKSLLPTGTDQRELGLVASSIALRAE
jgi:hypothetical protein